MNLHVPQSLQTVCEMIFICNSKNRVITPGSSNPLIGATQDTLIGSYLMTYEKTFIDWKQAMDILMVITGGIPSNIKKNNKYSGKYIYSALFPSDFNFSGSGGVSVTNGILEKGMIGKAHIGLSRGNIIHKIWNKYGPDRTRQFIDDVQRMMLQYLMRTGFTISIKDTIISTKLREEITNIIDCKKLEIYHEITEYEKNNDIMDRETFERKLTAELSVFRDNNIDGIIKNVLNIENGFYVTVNCGSNGTPMNIGQIIGCIGQVLVEQGRIKKRVNGRTLPFFYKNDDSSHARGFCSRSFYAGLGPAEFFFQVMAGREGIIETAIKSVTGDTPIVILEKNNVKNVKIGDWIDKQLNKYSYNVEHYSERDMELLKLKNKVYIPTSDQHGNVSWGEISAITRHDPGKELYEIKTLGGRQVIVTESKSLLIWNETTSTFERKSTPEVKIGDFVPVTMNLTKPPIINDSIEINAIEKLKLNKDNGLFIGLYLGQEINDINIDNDDPLNKYVRFTYIDDNLIEFCKKWYSDMDIKYEIVKNSIRGYSSILCNFLINLSGCGKDKFVPMEAYNAPDEFIVGILDGYFSRDVMHDDNEASLCVGCVNRYAHRVIMRDNLIKITSDCINVINGINMLCSRLGIFGTVKKYGDSCVALKIKDQWARLFYDKVKNLNMSTPQQKIQPNDDITLYCVDGCTNNTKNTKNTKYSVQNDVVLDKIIEINHVDISKYPKVYDLTVPSTLNFGLANGLHVVDTADTGYSQRKIIKALEDISVKYDNTVRNANDKIIQYVFGDNGISTESQVKQKILTIKMNDEQIRNKYVYTDEEIKTNKWDKYTSELNEKFYKKIIKLRNIMRKGQTIFSSSPAVVVDEFMFPFDLQQIIHDKLTPLRGIIPPAQNVTLPPSGITSMSGNNNKSKTNLNPYHILKSISEIIKPNSTTSILCMTKEQMVNKKSIKYRDEHDVKTLLKLFLYEYLAPKRCTHEYLFSLDVFNGIINDIKMLFRKAKVQPGEMVGIVAAQSIGEPLTQLSTCRDARIIIKHHKHRYTGPIGNFIDELLEKNKDNVIDLGNNSVVMDLKENYYIVGVSNDEKTSWRRISQISRHMPNGGMIRVHTLSGKTTCATLSHSFLKRENDEIVPVLGSELKKGDRIPICKYIPQVNSPLALTSIDGVSYPLDKDFGWFIGAYLADGHLQKKCNKITITKKIPVFHENIKNIANRFGKEATTIEKKSTLKNGHVIEGMDTYFYHKGLKDFLLKHFSTGSYNKHIPAFVYASNLDFISGIISGYFDGDGNVSHKKMLIRTASVSEQLTSDIILLLAYFGIFASKCLEVRKEENRGNLHTVQIQRKYAKLFLDKIGLQVPKKLKSLKKIIKYNERDEGNAKMKTDSIDMIPGLGEHIAYIGKTLELPGQSRNYGRWLKKEAIGRRTLEKYLPIFEEGLENKWDELSNNTRNKVRNTINKLYQAVNGDVIWDKIVNIEYLDDPDEYVYDFTVPGNDSFMVDTGVLVHNTLNTFHFTGTGKGSQKLGLPRIKEILSVTKNIKTPIMKLYLTEEYKNNKKIATKIASHLKQTTIYDIANKADIIYDPELEMGPADKVEDIFFGQSKTKGGCLDDISGLPWVIRIVMEKEKLLERSITLLDIKTQLCQQWLQRFSETKGAKKEDKSLIEKVIGFAVLSNNDNSPKPILHIRIDIANYDYNTMIQFLEMVLNKYKLKGIAGISDINEFKDDEKYIRYDNDGNEIRENQFMIGTEGVNLIDIRYINGLDINRCDTNDIVTIYKLFGVEAAKNAMIKEIQLITSDAGSGVNYQHVNLLVSAMTHTGGLTAANRHGINKLDTDPFSRASFEKTVEQFITAAAFGETDYIRSVSSRIMAGRLVQGGTGACDLLIDDDMLRNIKMETEEVKPVKLKVKTSNVVSELLKKKNK